MTEVTATELARNLSDFLSRAADGEEFRVTRGGRPIAEISPARKTWIPWDELMSVLEAAPSPDAGFEEDLRQIRREQNALPQRSSPLEWD